MRLITINLHVIKCYFLEHPVPDRRCGRSRTSCASRCSSPRPSRPSPPRSPRSADRPGTSR